MAILGLGTDIVEIERIEKVLSRTGTAFAERVLSASELEYFYQLKSSTQIRFVAKRFAVKEAASKALGTGIACGVSFQDFTVINDIQGKPILQFSGAAKQLMTTMNGKSIHVTIADERRYAVATVIIEN